MSFPTLNPEAPDWASIPIDDLCACESSLTFANSEGVRFLLPAFMLAQLEGLLPTGIIARLAYMGKQHDQLAALSVAQCNAVREFLLVLRDDLDYELDRQDIELAFENFPVVSAGVNV